MSFDLVASSLYWIVLCLWLVIFTLYIRHVRSHKLRDVALKTILIVLAIDAIRTIVESLYFGLSTSSQFGFLPGFLHESLSQAHWLLLPKLINVVSACLILFLVFRYGLPKELQEKTELLDQRADLSRQVSLASFTLDNMSEGLFWISADGQIVGTNNHAGRALGYEKNEIERLHISDIDPDYTRDHWSEHWLELKEQKKLSFSTRHVTKSGHTIPVDVTANYLSFEGNDYICAIVRDMSELYSPKEKIWRHANYDVLTELPNRRLFMDRLNEAIFSAKRHTTTFALLFIDLDEFKEINDTRGHQVGDFVLKQIASRLSETSRESDVLARLSGDEFALLVKDIEDLRAMDTVTDRLLKKITAPVEFNDVKHHVSASIGVAFYPDDALQADTLLSCADQAMFEAKRRGQNQVRFYTQELQFRLQHKQKLSSELKSALSNGELELNYQPIIELSSNRITEVETLIRWRHRTRGYIPPSDFIAIAEETDLIHSVSDWLVDKVLDVAPLLLEAYPDLVMALNTSPKQFKEEDFIERWLKKIVSSDVPPESIAFEVTEGLMMPQNSAEINNLLELLHQYGMQLVIDDFGTGYSSLSYIKRYKVDRIKIDQSFVSHLPADPHSQAICEAIIVMAHKLGMKVVAEGIENKAQLSCLKAMGCDYGQGYLLHRPMYLEQVIEVLESQQDTV